MKHADAFTPEQHAAIELQACAELAKRSMPGNYVYILLFLTLYWVAELRQLHPDLLFYMGVSMVLLCTLRGYLSLQLASWRYTLSTWKVFFFALTLAITALWSGLVLHHWHEYGLNQDTMVLLLLMMGITFGALPVLSLHQVLFRCFAAVLYLPLIIFGYTQADALSVTVANIYLIGLLFSLSIAGTLGKEYLENLAFAESVRFKEIEIHRLVEKSQAESAAKTTFLANMSHEIRTPMNGVMGMTEMLQKTALNLKQEAYVSVIQRSADALLSIINDILDYSKIESGSLYLDMRPFHLREMVDEVMDLMAHKGNQKGLEVILDIEPNLGNSFVGDAGRIRQMLINLMGNALKFTQEGEVQVSVATEVIEGNTHWLRFAVLDTGIGIAEHAQQKIFESFSQADNSTTRRFGGTGLGLAICWQLAELMQGELMLESTEGKYARFSFIIPLEVDVLTPDANDVEDMVFTDAELHHVLIVDGNRSTRRALCHQLDAWNIRYTAVDSAVEAWKILTKEAEGEVFTQVLLDMHMSGINGLDLASMIRGSDKLSTIRLLMLCADERDADTIKESSAFIDDYIFKPIRQACLFKVLAVQDMHPIEEVEAKESYDEASLLAGVRILIAEDNPVNQQVLVAMLELLGCHADIANNGLEVLSAVENQHFDLILMDCHMPQMDGLEATRQIREDEDPQKHLCIVALTANAMPEDRARCVQAGMDDYLSKPFTQLQLRKVIEKHCGKRTKLTEKQGAGVALLVNEQVASLSVSQALRNAPPMLDEESLHKLRALQQPNRANIVQRVMEMYLEDAPQQLQAIRDGMVEHDSDKINIAAHTLKSSSANIGALHLSEICFHIESLSGKEWASSPMLTDVEQAEDSFRQVSQEIIQQHLQEALA